MDRVDSAAKIGCRDRLRDEEHGKKKKNDFIHRVSRLGGGTGRRRARHFERLLIFNLDRIRRRAHVRHALFSFDKLPDDDRIGELDFLPRKNLCLGDIGDARDRSSPRQTSEWQPDRCIGEGRSVARNP
jgi:hypothetical protein